MKYKNKSKYYVLGFVISRPKTLVTLYMKNILEKEPSRVFDKFQLATKLNK